MIEHEESHKPMSERRGIGAVNPATGETELGFPSSYYKNTKCMVCGWESRMEIVGSYPEDAEKVQRARIEEMKALGYKGMENM